MLLSRLSDMSRSSVLLLPTVGIKFTVAFIAVAKPILVLSSRLSCSPSNSSGTVTVLAAAAASAAISSSVTHGSASRTKSAPSGTESGVASAWRAPTASQPVEGCSARSTEPFSASLPTAPSSSPPFARNSLTSPFSSLSILTSGRLPTSQSSRPFTSTLMRSRFLLVTATLSR